jgi:hypothetical protein
MSPVGVHTTHHAQQTEAANSVAQTRTEHAQAATRAHFATLYKGKTTFAHVHAKRLAARNVQARKLGQKLGARRPGMAKTSRFVATSKPVARPGKDAQSKAAAKKDGQRKVSRDQGRGGRNSQKDQQDRQQGQQGRQDPQRKQPRDEQARKDTKRRVATSLDGTQGLKKATLPAWLADAAALPDGPERHRAIAEACCDALLSLRQQLGTPATPAASARIYRHMQQMHEVQSALGALPGAGFGVIRQRLVDGAARRPVAETAAMAALVNTTSSAPVDAASRERLRSFNLLAGLMLLSAERPVTPLYNERAGSVIGSLVAGRETVSEPTTSAS